MGALLRLALLLQSVSAVMGGLNATWVSPTPGCAAGPLYSPCSTQAVCAPTYYVLNMGSRVRFTLAATNPTTTALSYETLRHCNVPGTQSTCSPVVIRRVGAASGPPDPSASCCNFNPLLQEPGVYGSENPIASAIETFSTRTPAGTIVTDVYPSRHNVTRVDFDWNTTDPELVVSTAPLPLFSLAFTADYGRLSNTSTCQKQLFFRLCISPSFALQNSRFTDTTSAGQTYTYRHVLASPAFYSSGNLVSPPAPNPVCGLDVGRACLSPAVELPGRHFVSVLTMSPPEDEAVQRWLWERDLLDNRLGAAWPALGVRVGQRVDFTVSATSVNQGETLMFSLVEDPGLPIGMQLAPASFPCGNSRICWNGSWTPHKGMEGRIHEARFVARGTTGTAGPGSCAGLDSNPYSIKIPVSRPKSEWAGDVPLSVNGYVGTTIRQTLTCRSNYHPLVMLREGGQLGGAELEAGEVTYEGDGRYMAEFMFSYTPMRGDEGTAKQWCFTCGDDQGVGDRTTPEATRCMTVNTRLCSYTVAAGETLQSITRRYQLSANWLNVWNANPRITDPDLALTTETVIKLGPTYRAKAGDTLTSIAAEFSTTVKKLLAVNPTVDLIPGAEMPPGTMLCVLTCTGQPSPSNNYKWAY